MIILLEKKNYLFDSENSDDFKFKNKLNDVAIDESIGMTCYRSDDDVGTNK